MIKEELLSSLTANIFLSHMLKERYACGGGPEQTPRMPRMTRAFVAA